MDESTMFGGFYVFPWIWGLCQLLVTGNPVYAVLLLAYGMAVKALSAHEPSDGSDSEVLFDEAADGNTSALEPADKEAASARESDNLMSGDSFVVPVSKPMDGPSGEDVKPGIPAVGDTVTGADPGVVDKSPTIGDTPTTPVAPPDDVGTVSPQDPLPMDRSSVTDADPGVVDKPPSSAIGDTPTTPVDDMFPVTLSPQDPMGSHVRVERPAFKDIKAKPPKREPCFSDVLQPRRQGNQVFVERRRFNYVNMRRKAEFAPSPSYIEEGGFFRAVPTGGSRAEDSSFAPAEETGRQRRGKLLRWFLPCCCE